VLNFLKCEKCGICCILEPCPYGMWDEKQSKCALLTDENLCGIYEYIKDSEIDFGKGCGNILLRDLYLEDKSGFFKTLNQLLNWERY